MRLLMRSGRIGGSEMKLIRYEGECKGHQPFALCSGKGQAVDAADSTRWKEEKRNGVDTQRPSYSIIKIWNYLKHIEQNTYSCSCALTTFLCGKIIRLKWSNKQLKLQDRAAILFLFIELLYHKIVWRLRWKWFFWHLVRDLEWANG